MAHPIPSSTMMKDAELVMPTEQQEAATTEAWLNQRVQQSLPTITQSSEMREYAAGIASLQMATFQKPPALALDEQPIEEGSWLYQTVSSLMDRVRGSRAPPAITSTASMVSQSQLQSSSSQSDNDLVIVNQADVALATAGWCWPWTPHHSSSPPVGSDTGRAKPILPASWSKVSAEDIARARVYARYASAAYCLSDSVLGQWSCPPHCQAYPGTTRIHRVFAAMSTGTRGYIATVAYPNKDGEQASSPNEVVVAFRGTLNLRGMAHDLYFAHADQEYLKRQAVCSRWILPFINSVSSEILTTLEDLFQRHSSLDTLSISGHSLGGALAILMAVLLLVRKPDWLSRVHINVYTFGEPRVGNASFAQLVGLALTMSKLTVVRVTNEGDPVPSLPPNTFEFQHHERDGS
ncbi:Alpha/Beta hydrolase protein [Syncephalis plumigaleata]|nr:Alpha/Beta hydrolase protein [Syncephalis plumigaleata]